MSNVIQVGQLRKDQLTNYTEEKISIQFDHTGTVSMISNPRQFRAGNIYYIPNVKVAGTKNDYTYIYLSDGSAKQYIAVIPFTSESSQTMDIAFVPKITCKNIYAEQQAKHLGGFTDTSSQPKIAHRLKNILPVDGNTIQKLGFQAAPGFTFVLNGELIRVGKSGTYSISDINVKTLGVVGNVTANPDNPIPFNEDSNYFLMDYQYVKEV